MPAFAPQSSDDRTKMGFAANAWPILTRHSQQTRDDVAQLRKRYAKPVFGRVRVWDLIEQLGRCVDPTDQRLFCASQQIHVLQMLDAMEADGTATPEFVLVALVHDLGKLLLLTDEDPANVVCMNGAIGENPVSEGLENCTLHWNHDEFAYERLRGLIPDELAWLVRYHSIDVAETRALMNEQDLERTERLLEPFAHYDHATKTPFHLPRTRLADYRHIIEDAFPRPILF